VTGDNRRGRGGLKITIDRSSGRVIDIDRRWHR
jgi:hypothetical protein